MKKIAFFASLLFSLNLSAQRPRGYCDNFESGSLGFVPYGWNGVNLRSTSVFTPGAGGTGTKCVRTLDDVGSSRLENRWDFQKLGTNYLNWCLSWNQKIFNDGDPNSVYKAVPHVYITQGGRWIKFIADFLTINESSPWRKVSAPIILSSGGVLPSSPGVWHYEIQPGLTAADFDYIMLNSDGIFFDTDYNSGIGEELGFDNVCVECEPPAPEPCNARFKFDVKSYTNPSHGPVNEGKFELASIKSGSTYSYDYGNGIVSTTSIPVSYAPGDYRICVSETTASGEKCTTCMDICIPSQNSLMTALPPCPIDFILTTTVVSDGGAFPTLSAANIELDPEDPMVTYRVNWGDGTGYIPIATHDYTTPGSYLVCVKRISGADSCEKCLWVCVKDPNVVTTGLSELPEFRDVEIYPNPASNEMSIIFNLQSETEVSVHITNILGQEVLALPSRKMSAGKNKFELHTNGLENGVYAVSLRTGTGVLSRKFIIKK